MGYTNNPAMVRVDFFKESGKWSTTEAVKWTGAYFGGPNRFDYPHARIHDAFRQSLADHLGDSRRLAGMLAVCLEPYHEFAHPITQWV